MGSWKQGWSREIVAGYYAWLKYPWIAPQFRDIVRVVKENDQVREDFILWLSGEPVDVGILSGKFAGVRNTPAKFLRSCREGAWTTVPEPVHERAPYGSKKAAKEVEREQAPSPSPELEAAKQQQRVFDNVEDAIERQGLSIESSDEDIAQTLGKTGCPLEYKCDTKHECHAKCPRVSSVIRALRAQIKDFSATQTEELIQRARNAFLAEILKGLCEKSPELAAFVEAAKNKE